MNLKILVFSLLLLLIFSNTSNIKKAISLSNILMEVCGDLVDNDNDGLVDEASCEDIINSIIVTQEICNDAIDNDSDRLIDEINCLSNNENPSINIEICGDLVDNDNDGQIDEAGCQTVEMQTGLFKSFEYPFNKNLIDLLSKNNFSLSQSDAIKIAQKSIGQNSSLIRAMISERDIIVYDIIIEDKSKKLHEILIEPNNGTILKSYVVSVNN